MRIVHHSDDGTTVFNELNQQIVMAGDICKITGLEPTEFYISGIFFWDDEPAIHLHPPLDKQRRAWYSGWTGYCRVADRQSGRLLSGDMWVRIPPLQPYNLIYGSAGYWWTQVVVTHPLRLWEFESLSTHIPLKHLLNDIRSCKARKWVWIYFPQQIIKF